MNDDQMAAIPIAFPLSLHQTTIGKKPRRWLIPADARFLVDTRQKLFGRVASHLTKPGEWQANNNPTEAAFTRTGDITDEMTAAVDVTLTWVTSQEFNGPRCSVVGDLEEAIYDVDPETGMPGGVTVDGGALWEVVDNTTGAVLGFVDADLYTGLTTAERLDFRWGQAPGGTHALIGYWARSGEPCFVLPSLPPRPDRPEVGEPVDMDAAIHPDSELTMRECLSVLNDLMASVVDNDLDEMDRVFDRIDLLDPHGKDLPSFFTVSLATATSQLLPPRMQIAELDVEVDADAGKAEERAVRAVVAHHNDNDDLLHDLISEVYSEPHPADAFSELLGAQLKLWLDTYRDNQARTEGTPANEDR